MNIYISVNCLVGVTDLHGSSAASNSSDKAESKVREHLSQGIWFN